jgi:hypothetical protein
MKNNRMDDLKILERLKKIRKFFWKQEIIN